MPHHDKEKGKEKERRKSRRSRTSTMDLRGYKNPHELSEAEIWFWGGGARDGNNLGGVIGSTPRLLRGTVVTQIDAGGKHVAFLSAESEVFVWGDNRSGQLGLGKDAPRSVEKPVLVESLKAKGVKATRICCGLMQTAAIDSKGQLWEWGMSSANGMPVHEPTLNKSFEKGTNLLQVVFGPTHTAVLAEKLQSTVVLTWGQSRSGMLGHGPDFGVDPQTRMPVFTSQPKVVEELRDEDVVQLSCNETHTMALCANGDIWAWGDNADGQLGVNSRDSIIHKPMPVRGTKGVDFCQVAAGGNSSMALTRDGKVYCWGRNRYGVLGLGDEEIRTAPTRVRTLSGIEGIDSGIKHSMAWTSEGEVYAWGCGDKLQLGTDEHIRSQLHPTKITAISGKNVLSITCGSNFTVARLGTLTARVYYDNGQQVVTIAKHPTCGSVLRAVGSYYRFDPNEHVLLDVYGREIEPQQHLRPLLATTEPLFFVAKIKDLFSEADAELVFEEPRNTSDDGADNKDHNKEDGDDSALAGSSSALQGGAMPPRRARSPSLADKLSLEKLKKLGGSHSTPDRQDSEELTPRYAQRVYPEVKGGTTDRLVEWLTFHRFTGSRYRDAFLLCYHQIGLSSLQLLKRLIARYEDLDKESVDSDMPTMMLKVVPHKALSVCKLVVLDTIEYWFKNHPQHFLNPDPDSASLVEKLLAFLDKTVSTEFPARTLSLRRLLLFNADAATAVSDNFRRMKYYPPAADATDPPLHNGPVDLMKYTSREIARQLTLIDFYDFFVRIEPMELLEQRWMKKNKEQLSPNVLRFVRRFNNGSEWVAAELLRADTHEMRVQMAEKFIEIGNELMILSNFNGVLMILSALSSTAVYRLKSVWQGTKLASGKSVKGISKKHIEVLENLRASTSRERNAIALRENFGNSPFPKIPFLGLYLTDLTFVDDGPPDFLDKNTQRLHNWSKRAQTARLVKEIMSYQTTKLYQIEPVFELGSWLMKGRGFENHEEAAWRLSKAIEGGSNVTNDGAAPIQPPLMPDISLDEYSTRQAQRLGDTEVQLLNSRAQTILSQTSGFDRRKLWRSWLRSVGSKEALFVDEDGCNQTFLDVFLESNAIELSIESAIRKPLRSDEQELLRNILHFVLRRDIDLDDFMTLIGELADSRLGDRELEIVKGMVRMYKLDGDFQGSASIGASFAEAVADEQLQTQQQDLNRHLETARIFLSSEIVAKYSSSESSSSEGGAAEEGGLDPNKFVESAMQNIETVSDMVGYFDQRRLKLADAQRDQGSNNKNVASADPSHIDQLIAFMRNIAANSELRLRELEQKRQREEEEQKQREVAAKEEGRELEGRIKELEAQRKELERQLAECKKSLKSAKKSLSRRHRRARDARKSMSKANQKFAARINEEKEFLARKKVSSQSAAMVQAFIEKHHYKVADKVEAEGKRVESEMLTGYTDYLVALGVLLDYELFVRRVLRRQVEELSAAIVAQEDMIKRFNLPASTLDAARAKVEEKAADIAQSEKRVHAHREAVFNMEQELRGNNTQKATLRISKPISALDTRLAEELDSVIEKLEKLN